MVTGARRIRHAPPLVIRIDDYPLAVDLMGPQDLGAYSSLCAWALARAHARSGDPSTISGYLGTGATFDEALGDFALSYADQNDRDHAALLDAIGSGRVDARLDI